MLPKNFYDDIEKPKALKHILYGDSVSKNMKTIIKFKELNTEYLTFDEIWNRLILTKSVTIEDDKEYILINDEIETVSYNIKNDNWNMIIPKYIMRHKINKDIIRLNFTNLAHLDVTEEHSMLDYDPINRNLKIKKPKDMIYVPVILTNFCINNSDTNLGSCFGNESLYYGSCSDGRKRSDSDFQVCKKIECAHIFKIRPIKITTKEQIKYNDYVYDFCIPETQNFIANGCLVHNTDSIFISIPVKNADTLTTKEKLVIVDKIAADINNGIIKYLNDYLLPKSNISQEYNSTYFKSELLMSAIMFLDVKKNYAYKLEAKKGKILEKPEIEYTGIQVIRSNVAKLTQDMLRDIIEGVILNEKIKMKDKLLQTTEIVHKYHDKFLESVNSLELSDLAIPGKWAKQIQFINGMMLYNFIMNKEIFSLGSAGLFIYCTFKNPNIFPKSEVNMSKVNGITIPQVYNKEVLRQKFDEFQIQIDAETQWDKLFSKTVERIVLLVKNYKS